MENEFDVIVLGTGLIESITAAALAKAGLKVVHIDPNSYYGGDEATLTLDELSQWADAQSSPLEGGFRGVQYHVESRSSHIPPNPKQYSISLSPSVIPSVGPFISSLISSGVARYGSYKLLGPVLLYHGGQFKNVPQNKETVFQDRNITLIEKRRLMRFLMFASGDFETSPEIQGKESVPFNEFLRQTFSLSEDTARVVTFALAYCSSVEEPTFSALNRVRSCLRSTGRYGSSPFLVGYYGGTGEVIQGFCRASAVNGGVYILGRQISNIIVDETSPEGNEQHRYSVQLDGFPDPLRSSYLLSSPSHIPEHILSQTVPVCLGASYPSPYHVRSIARCIAVVDGVITPPHTNGNSTLSRSDGESDSFLVVFPPGSLEGGSLESCVHVLTTGQGTLSAPEGKSIMYFSMPQLDHQKSSKDLLLPYLQLMLSTASTVINPMFTMFYMQHFPSKDQSISRIYHSNLLIFPLLQSDISLSVDQAAKVAENAFWHIFNSAKLDPSDRGLWFNNNSIDVNDDESEW
ncbi:GDP dissociation inhibitor-domain-containing protein [Phlebopus sp. FC_14]|nr:GDP dissociation inhibitor-domain-containing protein [Phlebopus sp. FC_14]